MSQPEKWKKREQLSPVPGDWKSSLLPPSRTVRWRVRISKKVERGHFLLGHNPRGGERWENGSKAKLKEEEVFPFCLGCCGKLDLENVSPTLYSAWESNNLWDTVRQKEGLRPLWCPRHMNESLKLLCALWRTLESLSFLCGKLTRDFSEEGWELSCTWRLQSRKLGLDLVGICCAGNSQGEVKCALWEAS